jgi:hypothetical protein
MRLGRAVPRRQTNHLLSLASCRLAGTLGNRPTWRQQAMRYRHPRIIATLEHLDETEWFTRVGLRGDITEARVPSSWQDAIDHSSSIDWQNIRLEAANQLRERILDASKERFVLWNNIAGEVREVVIPLVTRKIEAVVRENDLPPTFDHPVRWDILHISMEAEYADIVAPGFYARVRATGTLRGIFRVAGKDGSPQAD